MKARIYIFTALIFLLFITFVWNREPDRYQAKIKAASQTSINKFSRDYPMLLDFTANFKKLYHLVNSRKEEPERKIDDDSDVKLGKKNSLAEIDVTYTPETVTVLEAGLPGKDWIKIDSVEMENLAGRGKVVIHLYMEAEEGLEGQGEVLAFLENEGIMYDLGVAGACGLNAVSLEAGDVNHDGSRELLVTGLMGAAYVERKIISYDSAKSKWVNLLTYGTPWDGRLDGHGSGHLVAVSAGSLPGYVWLYRWNRDHFEKSDVAEATGNIYAYIMEENGQVWIEAGKPHEPRYYQVQAGKLVEIPEPR